MLLSDGEGMIREVWTYIGCAVRGGNRRADIGQSNVVKYERSIERATVTRELHERSDIGYGGVDDILGCRALRTPVSGADDDSEANLWT